MNHLAFISIKAQCLVLRTDLISAYRESPTSNRNSLPYNADCSVNKNGPLFRKNAHDTGRSEKCTFSKRQLLKRSLFLDDNLGINNLIH